MTKYILRTLGYQTELNNDVLDEKTQGIVKLYQKNSGLSASGVIDIETQKALNEDLAKIKMDADKQLLKALDILND